MLKKLGKYELVEEVGRGSMGEVYKANDPLIGRAVALKTITSTMVGDHELLDRFYREARSAGTLEHPNIVTIYELGEDRGTPFIAMEYLEGETLEKLIHGRSRLTVAEKVGFIVPVCRALDYAHKRGVVHRDIKPGNVMLTKDGKIKVVDFGIARQMNASMTQTNMFMGTLSYMSPQQIYGERADERSDIWALGVTFYELLCYRRPFEGDNHAAVMLSIAEEKNKPEPLSKIVPECPPALQRLLDRMLEKDIRARYQSMEEVLLEIEPLWQNLQHASVSGLIGESERLIGSQEFFRARDLLRKALQIDSRNDRAKALLEQASTEVRLIQTKSQVAEILARAQKLQLEERFKEAQTEAESALNLDPTSAEASELATEARRQVKRRRAIEDGLQLTRHCLAEGALPLAMQEVQKVLELDSNNSQGCVLKKQIQDQLLWREEQKRIAEALQRGRKLWADQRFEDCIALLSGAQKEFPKDSEITKLLETARLDLAEQQKLKGLAEARNLLASEQFDAALAKTSALLKIFPVDSAILKLQELVRHEKEEVQRREKRNSGVATLRSLVNSGQFSEAVSRGERLLGEFSQDAELSDLVSFASAEQAKLEQKRKLEEARQSILKKIEAEQFKGAVAAAERALVRFPADPAIAAALEQARQKLKEKENHELLQQRVGEIRAKINKGQHTDAVDLARQTLATLGPNDQTTHFLRMAEMELAQKREKQAEQEKQLTAVQTVVQEGRFVDATQILKGAFETQVLSRRDPRVQDLLKKIKVAKAAAAQTTATLVRASQPLEQPAPAGAFSIEQESQTTTPVPEASTESTYSAAGETQLKGLAATAVSGASSELQASSTLVFPSSPSESAPQEESLFALDYTAEQETLAPVQAPWLSRVVQTVRAKSLPFGLGLLLLLTAAVSLSIYLSNRATHEDLDLRTQAQRLEQQKDWPAALASFETLARTPRALASVGRQNASRLRKLLDQENSLWTDARDRESKGDSSEAKGFYEQVAALHGDKEQPALDAMTRLNAIAESKTHTKGTDTRPSRRKSSSSDKSQMTSKADAKTAPGESCQLIPSDVIRHLERAERDLGNGKYDDAERLYNDVLACEPNNGHARSGLDRTRKARAAERNLPSSN